VSPLLPQRGFAIALLLWMIAGMSLTVAAVIHFARADVAMAELRVREARSQAIGRGVAQLLSRDSAMATQTPAVASQESKAEDEAGTGVKAGEKFFSKRYEFENGWAVSGTLRPSDGFVSLNTADRGELMMLFTKLGEADEGVAAGLVDGVMEYRMDFPGFRYSEELLGVEGASRQVYDKIKVYVHPYRTGAMSAAVASPELASLVADEGADSGIARDTAPEGSDGASRGRIEGRITFESIAESLRNPNGAADRSISAAELVMKLPDASELKQTVWVGGDPSRTLLRSGPVTLERGRGRRK